VKNKPADDKYGEQETEHRFKAALRGARTVGHKPMNGSQPKPIKRKAERLHSTRGKSGA
jgi:hypothetical protein